MGNEALVPAGLAAALERVPAIPHPIEPLSHVDTGFFSQVYETASGWIVRVARKADAGERHGREVRFLPWLASQLPVPVPGPSIRLASSGCMPYGAIACPRLPGAVINPASPAWDGPRFAGEIAAFLARLHSLDVKAAREHGLDPPPPRAHRFSQLQADCESALRSRLSVPECAAVERWWSAFLDDTRMDQFQPVVIHGDAWWGNVLQERGRLTAVLDWEHARIDDAAHDLCGQGHVGTEFMGEVIRLYCSLSGADEGELTHRATQFAAMREFYGIQWSAQMGDEAEMADSIRKLRAGPILAGLR